MCKNNTTGGVPGCRTYELRPVLLCGSPLEFHGDIQDQRRHLLGNACAQAGEVVCSQPARPDVAPENRQAREVGEDSQHRLAFQLGSGAALADEVKVFERGLRFQECGNSIDVFWI